MNEPEMNLPGSADLAGQVAALRRQVFTLLLALIVVSGTLAAYLWLSIPYHRARPLTRSNLNASRSSSITSKTARPSRSLYQPTRRLRPDASGFPADAEEIRHSADAARRHAMPRLRSKSYASLAPQFGQKLDCGGNFSRSPRKPMCAFLFRRWMMRFRV